MDGFGRRKGPKDHRLEQDQLEEMLKLAAAIDFSPDSWDIHVLPESWWRRSGPHEGGSCLAKPWAIETNVIVSLPPEDVGNGFVCASKQSC